MITGKIHHTYFRSVGCYSVAGDHYDHGFTKQATGARYDQPIGHSTIAESHHKNFHESVLTVDFIGYTEVLTT